MVVYSALLLASMALKFFKQKYLPLDAIKVYIILYTPAMRQELYL